MDYLVRAARVTDIDRLVALSDGSLGVARDESPLVAADLMRQLVYLPQASIFVAETRRTVVGGAVLALRPSVSSGGYVGTIDLLVIDPDHDPDRLTEALVEECLRSASKKAAPSSRRRCQMITAARARLEAMGFARPDRASNTPWQRRVPSHAARDDCSRRAA